MSAPLDARWEALLCEGRRKKEAQGGGTTSDSTETRTEIERDYDRILFSTPVRRLADKTQVFPLERNDSVRTRLTHSHEVSNLARSIGTALAFKHRIAGDNDIAKRNIPALLAAIGLVHDLGNPPFGHQGEAAIQSWFRDRQATVLKDRMSHQQRQDFLLFEGNAQAFRLVTRLQLLNDDYGLDLTYATLSAMMKYPCGSVAVQKNGPVACKKHGFFSSEQEIAAKVQQKTGLALEKRHPFSYVMEACDDIAYVVLDIEDAVKKGLASFSDLCAYLDHHAGGDQLVTKVVNDSREKHRQYREEAPLLSPAELNDVSMQRFRVYAIGALVQSVTQTFIREDLHESFLAGDQKQSLMSLSAGESLRALLAKFAKAHAYNDRAVLELELDGYNVIRGLMDVFWEAIIDVDDATNPKSKRRHPFTRYVYGRISENYRRVYESIAPGKSTRYDECVLLTDMISGMTDSYAVSLYEELAPMKRQFDAEKSELPCGKQN